MQRWHLTAGLAALAVAGAFLAPRLTGAVGTLETPPQPPDPLVDVPIVPPSPDVPAGHLVVDARLDRTAVLRGAAEERFVAITLRAPENIGEEFRRPVDLGVVMDVSGSMSARGKIDYAKRGAKQLASGMGAGDTYSLVTFSDEAALIIPATGVEDAAVLHHAIDTVLEGGGTNLYAGLDRGSEEVRRSLRGGQIGRVILLSDGNANTGITDPAAMGRLVSTLASQGVTVSTIGLGTEYNEDLLLKLADLGGGSYDYVDDPKELTAAFEDELERSASVVARGTRVRIELPPGVEPIEVIGWDATQSGSGWSVYMGDLYAGDSRKIIARVRVTGAAADTMSVATATVDYDDVVDSVAARIADTATAEVTTSVARVESSVDKDVAVEAVRAWGNAYLFDSTEVYNKGDRAEAARLARQGAEVLAGAASTYGSAPLAADAAASTAQAGVYETYAPETEEGKAAVKGAKEDFNSQTRSTVE